MPPSAVKRAAGTAAALLLCLSSPALAQSSDNQPLSCVGNHHDGTIYAGGVNEFDILCGIDYAGADIRAAHANSFEHCIQLCEETDGCIVVSYGGGLGGGGCWMKDKLNTANPNGGIWTARSRTLPEPPVSCKNNRSNGTTYTSATGGEFLVLCGVDYGGGDMGVHDIRTFGGCMDKCDETPGCVDVSYVGTACYLKSQLGPLNHAGHVWTGRRISSSSTTSSAAATSTSSTSAAPKPTSTGAPTCEHNASDGTSYLAGSGSVWEIACGREYYGGDLRRETHPTFQACIESCDADSQCLDVSYVGADCWMKKFVTGSLVHAPHAWTAKKVQNAPGSGTTTAGTAAPTATSHPSVLTCVDKADDGKTYTTDNRKIYQIHCGADFSGSDLYARTLPSFEDCMHYCDSISECRGVSYAGDQCYPKSRLNDVTNRDHVWGAQFIGIAPAVGPTGTAADSPPLDTATVVMPEDPEWTATYTWYEQELPTFTTEPLVMPPDPTGTPLCLANPTAAPDAPFHLVDVDRGFLVNRGDRPGNPENPETEEEAMALLETIDSWEPSLYTWEHPNGAPEGVYDIVLTDETGKHYLSVNSDGEVVFASESSASTTIFSAGCDGRVIIHHNDVESSWVTNEDGFTTIIPHSTASDRIIVLPPQIRSPVVPESAKRSLRQSFNKRELGNVPRCPNRGADIFAMPKPFRRPENPNGCGSGATERLVPDFNWGHCCNDHDNCFDNCDKSFDGCNDEFLGCMEGQCLADLKWWNFWLYPGCMAVAQFYKAVVSSSMGVEAFNEANKDRCICPCPDPSVEIYCNKPFPNIYEIECRNVRSSDPNNCGGCGWTCPYKTKCARDSCQCEDDRCGNTCLNLQSHPNNCGRCGNKCDSGFCWHGVCYDIPENPTECIPGQALTNGHFPNGNSTGWSTAGPSPGVFRNDGTVHFDLQTTGLTPNELGFAPETWLRSKVRVCAGTAYDLTLRVKEIWTFSMMSLEQRPACYMYTTIGPRSWSKLPYWDQTMTFDIDPAEKDTWEVKGPWRIEPFQEGDGTVVNNVYMEMDLEFYISCKFVWPEGATVQLTLADISIHPAD